MMTWFCPVCKEDYDADCPSDHVCPRVEQLKKVVNDAKEVIQVWANKKGQERCHWHPEILRTLAEVLSVDVSDDLSDLPPESYFERGCVRFRTDLYKPRRLEKTIPMVEVAKDT